MNTETQSAIIARNLLDEVYAENQLDVTNAVSYLGWGKDQSKNIPKEKFAVLIESSSPEEITWEKDEAKTVRIPYQEQIYDRSKKTHRLIDSDFYMDATEVTVGQLKQFLAKLEYEFQPQPSETFFWNLVADYSLRDEYPMVYVSWDVAVAHAKWAEKRLPTRWKWESRAKGGLEKYPWPDALSSYANLADRNADCRL